ncbi:hypothetical protein OH807_31845 [Kitasatospora sp. NBC_01560]|uniref:hypothetical protein n=1 Tax=Kitasatospora sp. NBC_01560 TaxID=2975965 RepID=UPI0038678473
MSSDFRALGGAQDETILHETIRLESPIFAHLALVWRNSGRMVPGRPDHEWSHLTEPPPRFRPGRPFAQQPGEGA